MSHITPDMTEADIILPMIHFSKSLKYNLEWHHRHIERQKEDMQQWTTQELANVAVNKLAGRAWDREFAAIQPQQIASHYHNSTALQTVLPDGSISGNLARTIPEVITMLRAKAQLQETLKMEKKWMILIGEEIMASNARKFGTSSMARVHFSKQYTQQLYTEERAN